MTKYEAIGILNDIEANVDEAQAVCVVLTELAQLESRLAQLEGQVEWLMSQAKELEDCFDCAGKGVVRRNFMRDGKYVLHKETCSDCKGTGKVAKPEPQPQESKDA